MDADFARSYADLHARHWWFRARERVVERTLRRHVGKERSRAVLDVGCGDGLFLAALSTFGEVEGLEIEPAIVSERSRALWRIHLCPFDSAFTPGKSYGLITMLDVLEHIQDEHSALMRLRDLLEPGAHAVLTVPALPSLWSGHDELNDHYRRYTRASLRAALLRAGFEVVSLQYFFHWLVPVKVAIRVVETLGRKAVAPPRVPAEPWNRLAAGVCALEQRTWGRLQPPMGTSLIAVARRRPA